MFKIKSFQCKHCRGQIQGRSDKLFCDDLCRVRYHRENNQLIRVKSRVDKILQKNRSLLIAVQRTNKAISNAEDRAFWLRRNGFDFDFHTHVVTLSDGRMVIMCYEEGYILDGNGVIPFSKKNTPTDSTPALPATF